MPALRRFLDDVRWAWLMFRARRIRRQFVFAGRHRFDNALRPLRCEGKLVYCIGYPDALYKAKPHDFARAFQALESHLAP